MSSRIVPSLVLAVFMLVGGAVSAQAQVPGKDGLIAFSSTREGNAEIYTATRTGNTVERLTNNSAADTDPAFSPDGKKIAFVSDRDGDREIYVMKADGTDLTRITNRAGDDMDPTWSPDGTRLAIRRDVGGGNNEIVLIDAADGDNPVNLTNNAASDFNPEFSPDGTKIVFQRYTAGAGVGLGNEVFLMDVDGGNQTNLTNNVNSINDGRPSFAPDGSKIAFDSNRNDGRFEIYTMATDGSAVTRLTDSVGAKQESAFSPSGSKIAFRGTGIGLVPADGGAISSVTTEADSQPGWQADSSAPVTTITGGPSEGSTVNESSATLTFDANEPEAGFECRIDSDDPTDWLACDSPQSYSGLANGDHTFDVRATDLGGNIEVSPPSRSWTVNVSVPVASIDSGPTGTVNSDQADFSFSSDHPGATFECRLDSTDDADWASCSSPQSYPGLDDGEHTFQVRAINAPEVGPAASRTWTVDTEAPNVTIDANPAAVTAATDASFEFTVDDPGATLECRLDSNDEADWVSCQSPWGYPTLAEGTHEFELRATDVAGNATVVNWSWAVDLTPPTATIDLAPPAVNASIRADFEFSANEAGSTFECRLDPDGAGGWEDCSSPTAYNHLTDDTHDFEVRAIDPAGNVGAAATHSWEVATVKPTATVTSGPNDPVSDDSATFEFDSDTPGSTFQCRLDSADPDDWVDCASPKTYTGLTDGEHTFEVRAREIDQGTGPAVSYDWTVDTTDPTVEFTATPAAISGQVNPEFGFVANETGTSAECRLDTNDAADWASCSSPHQLTGLTEGEHTFEVRVTDAAGNTGASISYTWTVETTLPTATITSAAPESPTTLINASFSFIKDNPNATFECRIDSSRPADWATCESPVDLDQLTDGSHTFEVRAVGQGAGPGPVASMTWVVDTVVPTLGLLAAPDPVTNQTDATIEFELSKPGYDFNCSLDGAAPVVCDSPAEFSGLAYGDHTVQIDALDSHGQVVDSITVSWKILEDPPVAAITSHPPALSATSTAVLNFGSDIPEAGFECRIDGGAWRLCANPAVFTDLADGNHTAEVRASLPGGPAGPIVAATWEVDTAAPDLRISGGPNGTVTSDSAVFTVTVDDPSAPAECSLDEGPWVACDGEVSLTGLADGEHQLRARAIDPAGNTGSDLRQWSVDRIAPVTTLSETPEATTTERSAHFDFSANKPGSTFECRLDGSAWGACSPVHTVKNLELGSHEFAVRATDGHGNVGDPVTFSWSVVRPPFKGLVPTVKLLKKVKLTRSGSGRLGQVNCPEGPCIVTAPKRIKLRAKGKKVQFGVKVARTGFTGKTTVSLISSPRTSKLVARAGTVKIKVKVTVRSENGKRRSATVITRLTAAR